MLIVGLNGSPNRDGNTKFLLNKVLSKAESLGAQIRMIEVGEVLKTAKSSFCTACSNPCSGACYKGTALEEAFELIRNADALVLGSPVYFGTVSAQLKAFFDKSRGLRGQKALLYKIGAGVTVGASKYGGQETTMKALHDMMMVHGMTVVADGHEQYDCGHHGVCAQRPAESDEFALKRAEILGERLVEACKKRQDEG